MKYSFSALRVNTKTIIIFNEVWKKIMNNKKQIKV